MAPRLGQGLPGPPAAVRVLRGLRRLRRDPVPQADQPAVRRPAAGRQRHRLLLDLRRQPADHPLDGERRGAGAGLGQLAVRGQRRVRAGHPAGRRPAGGQRPPAPGAAAPPRSGRTWPRPILAAGQHGEAEVARPARAGRRAAPAPGRGRRPRRPGSWRGWPASWSGAASGSSAATAGPTTSARAASTTCSPPARTSTCWCSTPRSTPTPAARPPRRPRGARWPSSPPAASRPPRRTWACWPWPTATSTWPRWPSGPATSRPSRPCWRPRPGRARRWSSPTRPASPTAST